MRRGLCGTRVQVGVLMMSIIISGREQARERESEELSINECGGERGGET